MAKQKKYCYLYMTDAEILYYGPHHQPDYISAMHEFEQDAKEWVKKRGFKPSEIWRPGYHEIKMRIRKLWE